MNTTSVIKMLKFDDDDLELVGGPLLETPEVAPETKGDSAVPEATGAAPEEAAEVASESEHEEESFSDEEEASSDEEEG